MIITTETLVSGNVAEDGSGLAASYKKNLRLVLAKGKEASGYDGYQALALACREQLIDRWLATQERDRRKNGKTVYYLSLEFLMGRYLQNAVLNMNLEDDAREVMHRRGMVLEDVYEQEHEPGLGNGGLGRLAACFLDSLATCDYSAVGYGIRYQFGIFRQEILNGYQVEQPDTWLYRGNPWEISRPEAVVEIGFGGSSQHLEDDSGRNRSSWQPAERVLALPYDTPVPGYGTETVNTLRLWEARSPSLFNLSSFNDGDYLGAVGKNVADETISKVLYPSDHSSRGQELRLKQQYFFVAASLHDILSKFLAANDNLQLLPEKVAIQLNDTHPVIAIPELMRLLVDEYQLEWGQAWEITRQTVSYTNHTLLPEALERWNVSLLGRLLPRHLEIIYRINHEFLEEIRSRVDDPQLISRLSIIEEHPVKMVRMAHLAIIGSHSVNGVAELHSRLLKERLFPDFYELFPGRFNNKTNGVTPRRWLKQANPSLAMLITEGIGEGWPRDLDRLALLAPLADDPGFRERWRGSKLGNKAVFADFLQSSQGEVVDPRSMFDVQVKRIHEYKRQLLNILRVIGEYLLLGDGVVAKPGPRTVIIGGKAAPSYHLAKLIIRLAHGVASRISSDPCSKELLRLVFLTNYSVSQAERIIPATDLSEQISTAGYEASGTGNMKFAMNGALTIGTLDGANIEIAEAVGRENIFIFGLTAEEVSRRQHLTREAGGVNIIERSPLLQRVLQALQNDMFTGGEPAGLYRPLLDSLLAGGDCYQVLADFDGYCAAQREVEKVYRDEDSWARKSILNVAAMGRFSSDRTVKEYARDIWQLHPSSGDMGGA